MCARLIALALVAAVVGCSSPPDKERHQAEGALAAARAAGAAVYAADQLAAAEAALAQYDDAVAQGDYRLALRLALEARNAAYDATERSGDQRAATRLVDEAATGLFGLQRRLDELPVAEIQSARAARLRSLIDVGTTRLQDARTRLETDDFEAVGDVLEPFLQELRAESPDRQGAP